MFCKPAVSALLVTSILSSCGALSLGDTSTIEAQEQALFACAKAEGDDIFPITFGVTIASGTTASVQVEPNDRVSPELARKINACGAATLANAQADAASAAPEVVPVVASVPTVPVVAPLPVTPGTCSPGAGVLQGGAGYCVGSTN